MENLNYFQRYTSVHGFAIDNEKSKSWEKLIVHSSSHKKTNRKIFLLLQQSHDELPSFKVSH